MADDPTTDMGIAMKAARTWVVIADGSRMRIFENLGPKTGLEEIEEMAQAIELPASREILADRPGRGFESHGRARHAKENTADPHRELKRAFARTICGTLEARLAEDRFDRLVLVAPPSFLGDLRQAVPAAVSKKIIGEVALDLTKTPNIRLRRHLEQVLGPQLERPRQRAKT